LGGINPGFHLSLNSIWEPKTFPGFLGAIFGINVKEPRPGKGGFHFAQYLKVFLTPVLETLFLKAYKGVTPFSPFLIGGATDYLSSPFFKI